MGQDRRAAGSVRRRARRRGRVRAPVPRRRPTLRRPRVKP
ncbi:hypothetical protein HMPREF0591_1007 [Mycobacterium parascrofulaceum ATCC BAA-614]|uniref:Uncharacterized protein n=1 Tax=Mycobacterium parascrofulaceum ATCC BAA-614 TaxID=525368 RepID=D5P4B3_9MYCO|nr:hypothetical protein HMPREF0591_1007 [Mycobacterium parascrofulaceum ATCC BAA-614]